MAKVIFNQVRDKDLDSLIRRFKKQVKRDNIIEDCKKHQFFLKKSLRRKEKSKLAKIRLIRGK